jgi:exo-1,4-beta-D-glucosaminidase
MSEKFAKDTTLDVGPDSSTKVLSIPEIDSLSPTYFVRLELRDGFNKPVSTNFYWLSTTTETLDWAKTNYYVTPIVQHADMKSLNDLPKVKLVASSKAIKQGAEEIVQVSLSNPTKSLAFAVSLRLANEKGDDVLPAVYDDNYFPLMPGEKRTINIRFAPEDVHGASTAVHVDGWNIAPAVIHSAAAKAKVTRSDRMR